MVCKSIDIPGITILAVGGHPADPEPTTVLTLTAPLTVKLAEALRCKDMAFTLNDNARKFDGKFGLPLELGEDDAEIVLPDANGSRNTLRPHKIWKFRVGHETDLQLAVEFRAHFKGAADSQLINDLLQFVNQDTFGVSIVSTQGELFAEKAEASGDGTKVDMSPKPAKAKTACKDCDAGIPLMETDDGAHVNGNDCKNFAAPAAPTMADKKRAKAEEEEKKRAARESSGMAAVQ